MLFQFGLKSNYALAICILHLTGNCQKVCQWGAQCDCSPGGHFWTWTWSTLPPCRLTKRTQRIVSAEISDCIFYAPYSPCVVSKGDKKKESKRFKENAGVLKTSLFATIYKYTFLYTLLHTEVSFSIYHFCFWLKPRSFDFSFIYLDRIIMVLYIHIINLNQKKKNTTHFCFGASDELSCRKGTLNYLLMQPERSFTCLIHL